MQVTQKGNHVNAIANAVIIELKVMASEISGYILQYLRRLLRWGKLIGLKLGQDWLID